MDRQQFIAHARNEIAAADITLAGHQEQGAGCCRCGATWVCPVYETTRLRKAHFVRQLNHLFGN